MIKRNSLLARAGLLLGMALALFCIPAAGARAQGAAASTGAISIVAEHNGTVGTTPVAGLSFDLIELVGIDLSTSAGKAQAQAWVHDPGSVPASALGQVRRFAATDAQGKASMGSLPLGVYLLREVSTSRAYADMVALLPTETNVNGAQQQAYSLELHPKPAAVTPTPTPTATPTVTHTPTPTPEPTEPKGTQTGDQLFSQNLSVALLGVAMLIVAGAIVLGTLRRRREDLATGQVASDSMEV